MSMTHLKHGVWWLGQIFFQRLIFHRVFQNWESACDPATGFGMSGWVHAQISQTTCAQQRDHAPRAQLDNSSACRIGKYWMTVRLHSLQRQTGGNSGHPCAAIDTRLPGHRRGGAPLGATRAQHLKSPVHLRVSRLVHKRALCWAGAVSQTTCALYAGSRAGAACRSLR